MNTESIKTFLTLSKLQNFTLTAESLYISQSTVTKRICELERELCTKLFSRNYKHVCLTPEGTVFYNYAKRILELEEISAKEIHSSVKYSNHLRIGCTNALYESSVQKKIEEFHQSPDNSIKVVIGHSNELLSSLQDGLLDVVFSYLPLQKSNFECITYQSDNLVLVTNYSNTEYVNGILQEDLKKIHYLMCNFALQEVGQFIRDLFPLYHQFKFEIDNSNKLIHFLKSGSYYSFIPEKMIIDLVNANILRIIPLIDFETPLIKSYCVGNVISKNLWMQII
jgi:LysR family transcriptional repressor of citA